MHRVLDGLHAQIGSGERVAIMGRSGSGKSTLLNLISGIDRADNGTVSIDGVEVTALGEPARTLHRRAHIGFVYQFFNLIPTLDVVENVRLVLDLNGVRGAVAHARSLAVLTAVGLAGRSHSAVEELSGGEQQRVSIARAFVNHPPLLVCDEPTGNLDPDTSVGIMQLLYRINRTGTTVVMATHDREMVDKMRRRVIALESGRLVRDDRRGGYVEAGGQ